MLLSAVSLSPRRSSTHIRNNTRQSRRAKVEIVNLVARLESLLPRGGRHFRNSPPVFASRRCCIFLLSLDENTMLKLLHLLLELEILLSKFADLVGLLYRAVVVAFPDQELALFRMSGGAAS